MYIGTAGWSIPKNELASFPLEGTHLERYSKIFNAVEINTSFYKDHLPKSYAKWAAITPPEFRFSVKLNQRFTHTCGDASTIELGACLDVISELEDKWKVLLVQFPAGKDFNADNMNKMYKIIRKRFDGMVALEPRNLTWTTKEALKLMNEYDITKVNADPEKCPGINLGKEKYFRLHGGPEIYRSSYSDDYLDDLYIEMSALPETSWCIFDNTTFGHATTNALSLTQKQKGDLYGRTQLYEDRSASLHASHKH
ncbi:MAG: DUF72 domain-containing protein [Rhizobacter sp.]|nr:DUF72 domain-containing protein [Bacteriovorax sp.]